MRRLPIYFLLDVSESMLGENLYRLEEGLRRIIDELRTDPHALETAWVSVIAFAGRTREVVPLTEELRQATQKMADEMHAYFARGYTPKSKPGTHCSACSLKELCLPVLYQRADPKAYLRAHLDEMQEAAP